MIIQYKMKDSKNQGHPHCDERGVDNRALDAACKMNDWLSLRSNFRTPSTNVNCYD